MKENLALKFNKQFCKSKNIWKVNNPVKQYKDDNKSSFVHVLGALTILSIVSLHIFKIINDITYFTLIIPAMLFLLYTLKKSLETSSDFKNQKLQNIFFENSELSHEDLIFLKNNISEQSFNFLLNKYQIKIPYSVFINIEKEMKESENYIYLKDKARIISNCY